MNKTVIVNPQKVESEGIFTGVSTVDARKKIIFNL